MKQHTYMRKRLLDKNAFSLSEKDTNSTFAETINANETGLHAMKATCHEILTNQSLVGAIFNRQLAEIQVNIKA